MANDAEILTSVFPWEHSAIDAVKNPVLPALTVDRWPKWGMNHKYIST